jgi:hypothetical protein
MRKVMNARTLRASKIGLAAGVMVAALAFAPMENGVAAGMAPSGAIFTTLPDGSEVNFNQYASKDLVYLDGGPGPGAPATAAGLDDGTYVFQVTDPSGKTLLSTDAAMCREFTVSGGLITGVVAAGGCEHVTGTDIDHGATTVQLLPYNDTPNPGGVYKVWATLETNYLLGCSNLGVSNGLAVVDCGLKRGVAVHGFIPGASKTDNFKVHSTVPQEIDTRFHDSSGAIMDGMHIRWTDPLGASNDKWSYWAPQLDIFHEAHVEAVESGTHYIQVDNQPGCTVGSVSVGGRDVGTGPMMAAVKVSNTGNTFTIFVDVSCI